MIVSTGTRAALETIPGLAEAQPLTHIEALELDEIPEHLLVVGGGYVGVELSQAMRRFGSKVTIIDRNGRLMSREDPDVCEALRSLLADEDIDILLNARIKRVSGKSGDSVSVVVEQNGIEKVLKGSHILVATGRKPNTEGLGLELTGVELTDRGYIKVNERLQTTAPGVWAIGEVAGSPQFTHISVDDFRVVHANLTGGNRVTTGRQVPYCLFTDPELARIGLSETEAEAQGIAYRLFKVPTVGRHGLGPAGGRPGPGALRRLPLGSARLRPARRRRHRPGDPAGRARWSAAGDLRRRARRRPAGRPRRCASAAPAGSTGERRSPRRGRPRSLLAARRRAAGHPRRRLARPDADRRRTRPGRTQARRSATVAAVQGNVPRIGLDWMGQRRAVTRNHLARTQELAAAVAAGRTPAPDLVFWPENSSDLDPFHDAAGGRHALRGVARHRPADPGRRGAARARVPGTSATPACSGARTATSGRCTSSATRCRSASTCPGRAVLQQLVGRFARRASPTTSCPARRPAC